MEVFVVTKKEVLPQKSGSKFNISFFFHPNKVGCVFSMIFVSILPHAEFGPNDHQENAYHFTVKSADGHNYCIKHAFQLEP